MNCEWLVSVHTRGSRYNWQYIYTCHCLPARTFMREPLNLLTVGLYNQALECTGKYHNFRAVLNGECGGG